MQNERPTHPGIVFKQRYLQKKTVVETAELLGVTRQTLFQLIGEKRGLSPEMAIRIGRATGTDPRFWWNMQCELDLWIAAQKELNVQERSIE